MSDNSKDSLIEWSRKALKEAVDKGNITQRQANVLHANSLKEIRAGGYRGDISDSWKRWGFTSLDIPDMHN